MGRSSVKENKTPYQLRREELGYSREKASEVLEGIQPERIEKIESRKSLAHPEEILLMSNAYKKPALCNYYCSNECPIGKEYVPEIKENHLSQIVLEMVASLNRIQGSKDRLIEIASDGKINDDEIEDFILIRENLEKISITIEALQLWFEQTLDEGKIDRELYEKYSRK